MKTKRPILPRPAGPSEYWWNNLHQAATYEVVCELCGTQHPELDPNDDGRIIDRFLGLQVVEECCGRVFDILYREIGEEFALQFLRDFAENPTDSRFGMLCYLLPELLGKARQKAEEIAQKNAELRKTASEISRLISSIKKG